MQQEGFYEELSTKKIKAKKCVSSRSIFIKLTMTKSVCVCEFANSYMRKAEKTTLAALLTQVR